MKLGEFGTRALGEVPEPEVTETPHRPVGRHLVRDRRRGGWTYVDGPMPEEKPDSKVDEVLDYRFPEAPTIEYAGKEYTPAQLLEATGERYDLVLAARQAVAELALSNALHEVNVLQEGIICTD